MSEICERCGFRHHWRVTSEHRDWIPQVVMADSGQEAAVKAVEQWHRNHLLLGGRTREEIRLEVLYVGDSRPHDSSTYIVTGERVPVFTARPWTERSGNG